MADPKLVESILESYRQFGGINHLDGINLPSREAIAEILRDLLRIVFPGFYDRVALHSDQAPFFISQLLTSAGERLRHEIQKSLEDRPITLTQEATAQNLALESKQIIDKFLSQLPDVRHQ